MAPTCVVSRPTDLYGLSSIASTSAAEDDNDPFEAAFRLLSGPDTKSSYHRNPISRSAALMPPKASVQHTIALAVLTRLHQWCRQLIWLTLVCVIGCCGESTKRQNVEREIRRKLTPQANHGIAGGHRPPFRRSKSIAEIEQQLLRHLAGSPACSHITPRQSRLRRRPASAPPSPLLYDICEESDVMDAAELAECS